MSELITVDFKQGVITSRRDLEKPLPEWRATKDPDFKAYVEAMTTLVQTAYKEGGDWHRLVIALQPDPDDDENCMIVWDQGHMSNQEAAECLKRAAMKVESLEEVKGPDEPA